MRAILSVTNDIATDQRVHKVALTLLKCGYKVRIIGRLRKNSLPLKDRPYQAHRMRLLFNRKALFYAEYNLRLFFFLLFNKAGVLIANDLDTLPANYLASKIKRVHLVYDSHEYFCHVPELEARPHIQKAWLAIERFLLPKLRHFFTVNDSIASRYKKEYNVEATVVRNVPLAAMFNNAEEAAREKLELPENKKIILLQGAGININRGAEEAVQAMQHLSDDVLFLIIGGGDVLPHLKKMVNELKLDEKVKFINKMPFAELVKYTQNADVGLTLDKPDSLNYRYSLPNKLFDYIHAGVPVLASPLPEIKNIFSTYNIGEIIESHDPQHIAEKLQSMLYDDEKIKMWKEQLKLAAGEYRWEKEEQKLAEVYGSLLRPA